MKKISFYILMLTLVTSLNGCKTVIAILNSKKIPSADQQFQSLQANKSNLAMINTADISINIGYHDFDSLVVPAITKALNVKRRIPHVNKYSIKSLSISTDKQQIDIAIDFLVNLDTLNASVDGKLIGTISYDIKNDSLFLFPAMQYVHVNNLTYKKTRKLGRKVIAALINDILNLFMGKINGYMVSKLPVIPLKLVDNKIAATDLIKDPKMMVNLSDTLKISTPIYYSSTLVNPNGIHILASLTHSAATNVSTSETNNDKFDTDFTAFERDFAKKRNQFFPGLPPEQNSAVAISKNIFMSILNSTFNNETISASYTSNELIPAGKVDKHIAINLGEMHCGNIRANCNLKDCGPAPNCDGKHGLAKAKCELGLPLRWAGWQACHAEHDADVAACNVKADLCFAAAKVFADIHDQISLGDIHLTYTVGLSANVKISGIKITNDFSQLNLSVSADAKVGVNSTFSFVPEGPVGHIICALKFTNPYNCTVLGNVPSNNMSISGSFDTVSGNKLIFRFKTNSIPGNTLNFSPTPLQLISKDIPTLIDCPLVGALSLLGNITKGFSEIFDKSLFNNNQFVDLFFNGKFNFNVPPIALGLPIKPVKVKLEDQQILLNPVAIGTYIGFYNSNNYPPATNKSRKSFTGF